MEVCPWSADLSCGVYFTAVPEACKRLCGKQLLRSLILTGTYTREYFWFSLRLCPSIVFVEKELCPIVFDLEYAVRNLPPVFLV